MLSDDRQLFAAQTCFDLHYSSLRSTTCLSRSRSFNHFTDIPVWFWCLTSRTKLFAATKATCLPSAAEELLQAAWTSAQITQINAMTYRQQQSCFFLQLENVCSFSIWSTAQKEQIQKIQWVHRYNGMSRFKASIASLKTALQEKRLASQYLFVILGVTLADARVLFVGIALQRTHIHSPRNTYLGR